MQKVQRCHTVGHGNVHYNAVAFMGRAEAKKEYLIVFLFEFVMALPLYTCAGIM